MSSPVRVGAVSYLNTRPLVYGLERPDGATPIELSYAVPSVLADRMAAGELDVALLPVVELARLRDLECVPGLGIVTRGPSASVLLLSRRPLPEVDSVALDAESRTSNVLVQVLFDRVWGTRPAFRLGPGDAAHALAGSDAVVRIGDKALFEARPEISHVVDLGTIWTEVTGLPFVFAVWAARPGVVDRALYRRLHAARREGTRSIDEIAASYTYQGRRDPGLVSRYLRENILFRLGSAELEALGQFFAEAARLGLIDARPEIRLALSRTTECHTHSEARAHSRTSRATRLPLAPPKGR